jgi:hypothetical protein
MKERKSLQEQLAKVAKATSLQKSTPYPTVISTLPARSSNTNLIQPTPGSYEDLIIEIERLRTDNEELREELHLLREVKNAELTKLKEQCESLSRSLQVSNDSENALTEESRRLRSEILRAHKERVSFWRIQQLEMADSPHEVTRITPKAKRALVIYELSRSGEMPSILFPPGTSRKFPLLDSQAKEKIEIQRAHRWSELRWWISAARFLEGRGKDGSDFEGYKKRIYKEIEPLINLKVEEVAKQQAERRRLDDQISPTSSFWDRVDSGHWREQE